MACTRLATGRHPYQPCTREGVMRHNQRKGQLDAAHNYKPEDTAESSAAAALLRLAEADATLIQRHDV